MSVLQRSWQDHDLLHWLGKEAPRYTSYPSAHHFETIGPDTYATWLQTLTADRSVGLYVHVPFCEQMCWFCGCNTQITKRYDPVETYVDSLIRETQLVAGHIGFRPRVHALHFGGGSPGILSPDTLARLFDALHAAFELLPDAEVSIELDPRRLTQDKVAAYAAHGFNRVSLGVQDTQAEVQVAINRVQPMELMTAAVDRLRSAGIDGLGIDLVYGLPNQTIDSLDSTLSDVARLDPQRISAFSYAHVPWVKKHQRLIDTSTLPGIEDKARQFLQIDVGLRELGYAAIGIDHFAKADDGLARAVGQGRLRRNFMGYTDLPNDRLIALGASSISEMDGGIAQNIAQATSYESRIATGQLPTVRGWAYRDDDRVRGEVISTLMCNLRADVGEILSRHGRSLTYLDDDLEALAPFVQAGLVELADRMVTFTSPLRMLVRAVACTFDSYARETAGSNRYSRVA